MDAFQREVGEWADATFPHSVSGSIVKHLASEVAELSGELWSEMNTRQEAADCLLLLLHLAHKRGFDLLQAAEEKHQINTRRNWETDAGDKGYWKHTEEGGDG